MTQRDDLELVAGRWVAATNGGSVKSWRLDQICVGPNSEVLVVLTLRCDCLRWIESRFCWDKSQVLVEQLGLVCATVSQSGSVDPGIGADGFFDHTGSLTGGALVLSALKPK